MLYSQTKGNHPRHILFVHGNSQSGEVWESVMYESTLTDHYSCTMVDLPGHGNSFRSTTPAVDYSLQGMAQHLKAFVAQYQDREYILVGSSLGTNLIGEIADSLMNCKGVLLVGADIIGEGIQLATIFQPNPNAATLFSADPTQESIDALVQDLAENLSEEQKILLERLFKNTDPLARTTLFESIAKEAWSDEIARLTACGFPIAVAYGANEKLCHTGYLNTSAIKKWKDQIFLIPDSGHCPQLDNPGKLGDLLADFAKDCFK